MCSSSASRILLLAFLVSMRRYHWVDCLKGVFSLLPWSSFVYISLLCVRKEYRSCTEYVDVHFDNLAWKWARKEPFVGNRLWPVHEDMNLLSKLQRSREFWLSLEPSCVGNLYTYKEVFGAVTYPIVWYIATFLSSRGSCEEFRKVLAVFQRS